MNRAEWRKYKIRNAVQSLVLVLGMAGLLSLLGYLVGGPVLAFMAMGFILILYLFNPILSPHLVLRMYRARPISPYQASELYALAEHLARRGKLPRVPALYYIPSDMMNAFAVGSPRQAMIAFSDGLLRRLNLNEIAGVLAHEISHIAHDDMSIMSFADLCGRLTRTLSFFGQVLLLINLPLLLMEQSTVSWLAIALLILAPSLSALLQLALSRIREYDADLGGAKLLGDPVALASALSKMEAYQGNLFEQVFMPDRLPNPSILRTHPPTQKRVKRLLAMRDRQPDGRPWRTIEVPVHHPEMLYGLLRPKRIQPRWHFPGLWF